MGLPQIFKALGDSVRLTMIERLADGSTLTIGEICQDLGVTRQGARKQLQVLVKADMVALHVTGRETRVKLNRQSLSEAKDFIQAMEQQWDARLAALKQFVED